MGTLDRRKVHKDGGVARGRSRHVRPRVEFEYSKPGSHRLGPFPCSSCYPRLPHGRRRNASGQTPPLCLWNFRPRSPPPDAIGFAVPDQAGDVLSVVHRLFHHDGLFAPCGAVWSASRTCPATQRRSGPVANAARCGVAPRASGWRVKAGNTCRGMPAFGQPFCAIVQEIVWDLPTSLPDSAARGDREGRFCPKRTARWWKLRRRPDFPIRPPLPGLLQTSLARLRESGGVNTHTAGCLSKYANTRPLPHTNRFFAPHLKQESTKVVRVFNSAVPVPWYDPFVFEA